MININGLKAKHKALDKEVATQYRIWRHRITDRNHYIENFLERNVSDVMVLTAIQGALLEERVHMEHYKDLKEQASVLYHKIAHVENLFKAFPDQKEIITEYVEAMEREQTIGYWKRFPGMSYSVDDYNLYLMMSVEADIVNREVKTYAVNDVVSEPIYIHEFEEEE